jgi:hypothetical protein
MMPSQILPRPVRHAFQRVRHKSLPELAYLETHLADHCNLNCKGCGHFSSLSPEHFTDLDAYEQDIRRLRELVANVRDFRLLGGEPLLHPQVTRFLEVTRRSFPEATLRVVTNGLLLPRMPTEFWESAASHRGILLLSLYPIRLDLDRIRSLAARYGVLLEVSPHLTHFAKHPLDLQGRASLRKSFAVCRRLYPCPFLESGNIYPCGRIPLSRLFCQRFGRDLPVCRQDSIRIHGKVTGTDLVEFLQRPVPWCRFCRMTTLEPFEWCTGEPVESEWV